MPNVISTVPASTTAMSTFISGPPSITRNFFHHGCR